VYICLATFECANPSYVTRLGRYLGIAHTEGENIDPVVVYEFLEQDRRDLQAMRAEFLEFFQIK